jgi:recombination protein RecR
MYPDSFQRLINQFSALPGIGPKMAERLVLFLFKQETTKIDEFIIDLSNLHKVTTCTDCFNITQNELCTICADKNRERTKLCIVEESLDIIPIERSGAFKGLYHVLGGTVKKRDKAQLTTNKLVDRIKKTNFEEIIIATNFTTEGDMTAMYLRQTLAPLNIPLFRLARGLATGSDIEYADDMTIRSSLTNKQSFS